MFTNSAARLFYTLASSVSTCRKTSSFRLLVLLRQNYWVFCMPYAWVPFNFVVCLHTGRAFKALFLRALRARRYNTPLLNYFHCSLTIELKILTSCVYVCVKGFSMYSHMIQLEAVESRALIAWLPYDSLDHGRNKSKNCK